MIMGSAVMHAASTHPTRGKGASDIDMFVYAEEEDLLYQTLRALVTSFTLLQGGRRRQIVVDRMHNAVTLTVEGCGEMMIQMVSQAPPPPAVEPNHDEQKHTGVDEKMGLEPFLTSMLLSSDAPLTMMGIGAQGSGDNNEEKQEQELMFQLSAESLYGMETGLVRFWQSATQKLIERSLKYQNKKGFTLASNILAAHNAFHQREEERKANFAQTFTSSRHDKFDVGWAVDDWAVTSSLSAWIQRIQGNVYMCVGERDCV